MRKLLVLALVLGLVGVAAGVDLGNQAPEKVPGVYPVNVPNPILQGGDLISNATVIASLPYSDTGTTVGYNNDYQGSCIGSTAPDVVYTYTATTTALITISLCGSTYDTGLYVKTAALVDVACNDDFCGLQSQFDVTMNAGTTYYIFIDGYSTASGAYTLNMRVNEPCILPCTGFAEGEPLIGPGYVDAFNGGCNSTPAVFQILTGDENGNLTLCGQTGWYVNNAGGQSRDTDWIGMEVGPGGSIEVEYDGEFGLQFLEITSGLNCPATYNLGTTAGPCAPQFYTFAGAQHQIKVMWLGPSTFPTSPTNQNWAYVVHISGLEPGIIATETATWGTVKALYR